MKFKTRAIGEKTIKAMKAANVEGAKAFANRPVKVVLQDNTVQWKAAFVGGTLSLKK